MKGTNPFKILIHSSPPPTRSGEHWWVSEELQKEDGFLRAKVGGADQLVPPVQGWQFKLGTKWSSDEVRECSREVEEIIRREEERIKQEEEKEERRKRALVREEEEKRSEQSLVANVDAAAANGDLAFVKQLQQMDSSGDLSLSS